MKSRAFGRAALAGGVLAAMLTFVDDATARGGFGGGARGGGMSSIGRGGGGSFGRGGGSFGGGSGSFGGRGSGSLGGGSSGARPSQLPSGGRGGLGGGDGLGGSRPGGGGEGIAGGRPGGGGDGTRPGGGGGGANRPNRPGNGDVSIGSGNNINIDNDWGWNGWDDHIHHPIAAGIAIGATAAAVYGSMYYSLPAGCGGYPWGGYSYYDCGGYYLEPRYEGDTIVYVTVPDPKTAGNDASGAPPASAPASTPRPSEAAPAPSTQPPPEPSGAPPAP